MAPEQYRQALDAAIREYETLGAQRREIDERLTQLTQVIGNLNRLCGFVSTVPWGLTDACRVVLKNAGKPMTPTDVRDRLESIGFDLAEVPRTAWPPSTRCSSASTRRRKCCSSAADRHGSRASGASRCVRSCCRRARLAAHLAAHAEPEPRRKRRRKR